MISMAITQKIVPHFWNQVSHDANEPYNTDL